MGHLLYGILAYTAVTFLTVYCANFVFDLNISLSLTDWYILAGAESGHFFVGVFSILIHHRHGIGSVCGVCSFSFFA